MRATCCGTGNLLLSVGICKRKIMSDNDNEVRTRTVSWEDPHVLANASQGLSGLEGSTNGDPV